MISDTKKVYSADITSQVVESGQVSDKVHLEKGQTVNVLSPTGIKRGVYTSGTDSIGHLFSLLSLSSEICLDLHLGDIASFRSVSEIRNYEAQEHVTPVMDLAAYFKAGVFTETTLTETTKWIDPNYRVEDVSLSK